jgi:hypothetical protein
MRFVTVEAKEPASRHLIFFLTVVITIYLPTPLKNA